MAITRTQIAKQLLANGGRTGFFSAGLARGDDISPGTSTSGGDRRSQDRPNMRDIAGPVRPVTNPVFGDPDPEVDVPTRLRKDTGTSFLRNLDAERRSILKRNPFIAAASFINPIFGLPTLFKVAKQTSDMRKTLGTQSPKPVDFSGMDRGGDIPLWAQLGYSSEAEYLAAVARKSGETEQVAEGDSTEEKLFDDRFLRFRAEGGPIGGEYDFESARQMYGLGKLVKKVTRTVKKIAKSPIGKAALIGGGLGLAGIGPMAPLFSSGKGLAFKQLLLGGKTLPPSMGFKSKGLLGLIKENPFTSITAVSALAGLLTPAQEEEAQELAQGEGIDIEAARRSILNAGTSQDFRSRRFVAEGGSMKEPVAKKTMPLLDMGGKEMDLRAEGGFVPIGRMEKADDVPARLSKNEFVFTADAVRNAGDGDVDKGAEVMYNMMKNLESGGEVSEESQGLEGARKMFQTSQRLEEVL